MSQVITVTSGKGGVGKTTTSASIALGLAKRGFKTCAIDFDIGLRNLDFIMGVEKRVIYDIINVIESYELDDKDMNKVRLNQALVQDKNEKNLYILAASNTRDKDSLTKEGVRKIIEELNENNFDYIVCDSPAGIEQGAIMAMYFADMAVVVSNPESSSILDSDKIIGLLDSKTFAAENDKKIKKGLLITRYDNDRAEKDEMVSKEDMVEILSLDVIGLIPESKDVLISSNIGKPVILWENSFAAQCYEDAVSRMLGEEVELKIKDDSKKPFLKRLFGG